MVFMVLRIPRDMVEVGTLEITAAAFLLAVSDWGSNTFQKRKLSSADAEMTVVPSGDKAICKTRAEWPVSSPILTIEGYFQTQSWFFENPWDETNSFWCLDHWRLQTWLPVSIEFKQEPV